MFSKERSLAKGVADAFNIKYFSPEEVLSN